MAEIGRENVREPTLEGLDAPARKGEHGGRPLVITEDVKRKGRAPGVASVCQVLAEHEKQEAPPEAVAQAHADSVDLQDADDIPRPYLPTRKAKSNFPCRKVIGDGRATTVSTPVYAERAWQDLQRIRVPQERVYDEFERSVSGGRGMTYGTAALMWVFLAGVGMDLPRWGVALFMAVYVGLLSVLVVMNSRRNRMQLHHTRCPGRMWAAFGAAAVLVGGTIVLADHVTEPLAPIYAGPVQATAAVAVYLLCLGPANRWAADSVRSGGEPAAEQEAGR